MEIGVALNFTSALADALRISNGRFLRGNVVNIEKMCYNPVRGDTMFFDDLKPGMTVDTAPAVIEKEKMLAFAHEYDFIPLHTDEDYAKSTPFGQLIAPGVMSFMSVWAKYLEVDFFGQELLAGKSTKIEWLKPVYAGDVLTGKVTVTNLVKRSNKNGIVEISVDVYNQNGVLVLTNVTEAIVKCKLPDCEC